MPRSRIESFSFVLPMCNVNILALSLACVASLPWAPGPAVALAFLGHRQAAHASSRAQPTSIAASVGGIEADKSARAEAASPSRPSNRSVAWEGRLEELRQYKEEHGHCNVPAGSGKLAIWVANQRAYYKLHKNGDKSSMTEERISALEALGFVWKLRSRLQWEDRVEELRQFKEEHGHCNVPSRSAQLAIWVANQRMYYKLHKNGEKSPMTEERKEALDALGFRWSISSPWEDRFEVLRQFKEEHGHCNVPSEPRQLASWVNTQRTQHKLWEDGKKSSMTEERKEALDALGFRWQISVPWEDRFEELRQYKEKHGHCNVPRKHPLLGRWVNTQRTQHKLWENGKESIMTEDRRDALATLGFVWSFHSQVPWEDRFEELRQYKEKHGHCNVPTKDPLLGPWVSKQRMEYRKWKNGDRSQLMDDRRAALDELDFVWRLHS